MSSTPPTQRIRQAAEYIQANWQQELPLRTLSREAGLSPFYFQRSFKSLVGVTPKQYQEACRLRALKQELRAGDDVLQAIFAAGFGSTSRVYERVDTRLGMTPTEYRAGGADVGITHATIRTRLGLLTIGATDRGLCFVQFGASEAELIEALRREYPSAPLATVPKPWPEPFWDWVRALQQHLEGAQPRLDLPLDIRATAFQMRVWRYLQSIPYGETRSYRRVAEGIGQPTAARAVASACARNRMALVIPCHRVIRGTGELGGYRWGLKRKRALLEGEQTKLS
ncbi:MAG: bifunctional DNA-binding transcriptional regulator/O6-methylguanine-DNA methyltransferase Ada [Bryobacterales bacterium]|nr:bifunctional DNA-binding transcriptional regulator/O6-methylguanine-DNA methyltransferase Ada [Bryobacterales bacterium]